MNRDEFLAAALRNPVNRIIADGMFRLALPDAWIVAGCLVQTVWNVLTGRAVDYGIADYDVFYFDADTSWEAEDAVIRKLQGAFEKLGVKIEARNQARVHLWYSNKFGITYSPLQRATEGIDRFLTRAAQVGIRPAERGHDVHAPHGFDDIAMLTIRPNRCPNFRADLYEAKAATWKARWPELRILPATDSQS